MAFDYAPTQRKAQAAVEKYGRLITLRFNAEGVADEQFPLHGGVDPELITIPNIRAVFVEPSGVVNLGSMATLSEGIWRECEKIAIVAATANDDFSRCTSIIDADLVEWKVKIVKDFKPGDLSLLYYIGVKR